jgi:hypothetical protein
MRTARGTIGSWNATISPGDEVLACIHKRFSKFDPASGEILYSEPFSDYAYEIDIERNVEHVKKISADGKAILTSDKATFDKAGKITNLQREEYIGIMEVYEAEIVDGREIKLRGKIIERLV